MSEYSTLHLNRSPFIYVACLFYFSRFKINTYCIRSDLNSSIHFGNKMHWKMSIYLLKMCCVHYYLLLKLSLGHLFLIFWFTRPATVFFPKVEKKTTKLPVFIFLPMVEKSWVRKIGIGPGSRVLVALVYRVTSLYFMWAGIKTWNLF